MKKFESTTFEFHPVLHLSGKLRHCLSAAIMCAGALSVSNLAAAAEIAGVQLSSSSAMSMSCVPALEELRDPATITADSNLTIDTALTAQPVNKCINGKIYSLQSYIDSQAGTDSRPVGPAYVFYVNQSLPKDPVLKIAFKNELAPATRPYHCEHHSDDVKACTNLHTHGLHVSPKDNHDNVFLTLAPGDTQNYVYDISKYHPPGTHWLHAHLHGSTASQLQNGMAGAIILKGEIDDWLASYNIRGRRDKIMLLQQLQINDAEGETVVLCGNDESGEPRTTSINGQCLPVINVQEGEVHHWRLIHGGISQTVDFAIESAPTSGEPQNIQFFEYARDGIALGRSIGMSDTSLQPGYRSDILLQIPKVDTYCPGASVCELHVVDEATEAAKSLRETAERHNVVAKVIIHRSNAAPMTMPPSNDPHFAKPYKEISDSELSKKEQQVYFGNLPNPDTTKPPLKTVNGKVYPATDTIKLKLGEAQTWRVWVNEKQTSSASHPYHIHVNPFEVIIRDAAGKITDRYWKDTLLISGSANKGKTKAVEIRSRYENFDGEFVLHCHNLDHEDEGMMMNVTIAR